MLKVFTCLVIALALLALLHPSFARKGRGKGKSLKRLKIKKVCLTKKDLGQVLSIVSAVDLTVRYTHGKVGLLQLEAKHLKKANKIVMKRLAEMDTKLTKISRMIRKAVREEKPKSLTVCEGKKATLTCKRGRKIKIVKANYGRLNKRVCKRKNVSNTKCKAAKSMTVVRKACDRKTSCVLHANNGVYGDPCKGTDKYLVVKFKCES